MFSCPCNDVHSTIKSIGSSTKIFNHKFLWEKFQIPACSISDIRSPWLWFGYSSVERKNTKDLLRSWFFCSKSSARPSADDDGDCDGRKLNSQVPFEIIHLRVCPAWKNMRSWANCTASRLGRQSSPAQREDEEGEQNGIPQRTRETARDRDSSDRRFSTRSGKICEERKSGWA